MRALAYIRVSTAEQATTGHSIGQQQERLRAWCQAKGYELVGFVADEGVSAGKPLEKRAGGAELLRRMAAGDADVVVVVSIDRIFRNAQDGLNTLLGVNGQGGLALQSITDPCDTTTAMGRFILTIWLARAQLEREQTCERNTAIAKGLRAAGRPNGHTPYGCVVVDGRLYRDPVTWPIRERIVELRTVRHPLTGNVLSTPSIADLLQRDDIPAPRGGAKWDDKAVSRIVNTHGDLKHLPPLPTAEETAVSPEQSA